MTQKLIDLDALKAEIYYRRTHAVPEIGILDSMNAVYDAPIVDAVPVAWIIEKHKKYRKGISNATTEAWKPDLIDRLLEDWNKEKESKE